LLGVATDLTDHHDRVGLGVVLERTQAVDVRRTDHRVPADADAAGETDVPQLVHHLVGQGAALADQADPAGPGDVRRDDARVGLAGRDDARAVGPDDPGLARLGRVGEEVGRVL